MVQSSPEERSEAICPQGSFRVLHRDRKMREYLRGTGKVLESRNPCPPPRHSYPILLGATRMSPPERSSQTLLSHSRNTKPFPETGCSGSLEFRYLTSGCL